MATKLEKLSTVLAGLSVKELQQVITQAETLQAEKLADEKAAFVEEVRRMAEDRGLDVADVLASPGPLRVKAKTSKLPPKYRNPDNPNQVWNGRGRAPAWAAPYRQSGKLDEIAIKG